MPTYSYACRDCDHRFDITQAFSDDALTTCPACGGGLRKVYGSVGVVFKGSGFYRTDSRKGSVPATSSDSGSSGSSGSSDSGSSGSTTSGGDSAASASASASSTGSGSSAASA